MSTTATWVGKLSGSSGVSATISQGAHTRDLHADGAQYASDNQAKDPIGYEVIMAVLAGGLTGTVTVSNVTAT